MFVDDLKKTKKNKTKRRGLIKRKFTNPETDTAASNRYLQILKIWDLMTQSSVEEDTRTSS